MSRTHLQNACKVYFSVSLALPTDDDHFRDPNDRICVGDILSCSWCRDLQPSDPPSPTVEYENGLPKLSPEQQQHILHVMEDNGMNKDDILRSLRNNQFDSMASTYCLLAEREV